MNTRTMPSALSGAATTIVGTAASVAEHVAAVRVLILTGANNHDWKATTPVLSELYDRCPRFKVVDVIDDPAALNSGKLATCDVVVSNWSAYPEMTRRWGATAEKAFVDFINSGKGFVVFHAASATCQDWPEFQQLVALTWRLDHTAHGSFHTFKVAITDRDHPITRGMKDFWTTDELWHNMANLSGRPVRALAQVWSEPDFNGTNKFEPVLVPTVLGQGRGLNVVLGHDAHAMLNVGWRTIMLRGTEWAATGTVTIPIPGEWPVTAADAVISGANLDAVLARVPAYRFGRPREALYLVQAFVTHAASQTGDSGVAARRRLAAKLVDLLAPELPLEVREFACTQLGQIGTQEQVPAIAALLADDKTADMARSALVRIPGPAGAKALRDALAGSKGRTRIGIINSLGELRDAQACGELIVLLQSDDLGVVQAAAAALGKIGGTLAAKALLAALARTTGETRALVADAALLCADARRAAGDAEAARAIYTVLWVPSESLSIRMAALRGLALCLDGVGREALLKAAAVDPERRIQQMAAGLKRGGSPAPSDKQ